MDDCLRNVYRRLGWFRPSMRLLGHELRPLSLPSHEALDLMGLRILEEDPGLSPLAEAGEVQAYVWLHVEPVPVVGAAIWTGDWRAALDTGELTEAEALAIVAEWRAYREPIVTLVRACDFTVRSRPSPANAPAGGETPGDVIHATRLSHRQALLLPLLGGDPARMWEVPWWEAMLLYHALQRIDGKWTVPKCEEATPEAFADFQLGAMEPPANDTDPVGDGQ